MLEDNLYLENLQEFIQDEKRIVTYKWLSRKLDVPADTAKQMLYTYVDHCRSSKWCDINVIYVITGAIDQGKAQRVCLVTEDELEATKKTFNPLRSVHIYSVQQTRLKDSSALYSADYDICKEHIATYSRWSPIDCPAPTTQHTQPTSTTSPIVTNHTLSNGDTRPAGNKVKSDSVRRDGRKPFPVLSGKTSCRGKEKVREGGRGVVRGGRGGEGGEVAERKVKESADTGVVEHSKSDNGKPADNTVAKLLPRKPETKKGGGKKQKEVVKWGVPSFFSKQLAAVKKEAPSPVDGGNTGSTTAATAPNPLKKMHAATSEAQSCPTTSVGGKNRRDKVKSCPIKSASRGSPETSKSASSVRKTGGWLKGLDDSDIDDGSDSDGETVVPVQKEVSRKMVLSKKSTESTKKVAKVPEQRKRKRIQNMSSDEEESGGIAEHQRETRDDEKETRAAGKRRKRVKRLRTKMYTTEDGAMERASRFASSDVTEKVWESVSTDESDTDGKSCNRGGGAKESPVKGKSEQCSPAKGTKQSLLMNYFKK